MLALAGLMPTVGLAFTTTVLLAVPTQPFTVTDTVYDVVVLGETVTIEPLLPLWLQLYVPPPLAFKVIELPLQMDTEAPKGVITGVGTAFTVTNRLAVAEQVPLVTVTVYVVLLVGLKVADALLPPLLLHAYVLPPLAVRVTSSPLQMVAVAGEMLAVGVVFTVTVLLAVAVQLPLVTVTV